MGIQTKTVTECTCDVCGKVCKPETSAWDTRKHLTQKSAAPARRPLDCRVSANPTTENEMELTFEDALRIARGCTDYGGGYRSNAEHFEIYQHGIQTVINALTAASKTGLDDMQTRVLHSIGANA